VKLRSGDLAEVDLGFDIGFGVGLGEAQRLGDCGLLHGGFGIGSVGEVWEEDCDTQQRQPVHGIQCIECPEEWRPRNVSQVVIDTFALSCGIMERAFSPFRSMRKRPGALPHER
jgi:hypothetical protein